MNAELRQNKYFMKVLHDFHFHWKVWWFLGRSNFQLSYVSWSGSSDFCRISSWASCFVLPEMPICYHFWNLRLSIVILVIYDSSVLRIIATFARTCMCVYISLLASNDWLHSLFGLVYIDVTLISPIQNDLFDSFSVQSEAAPFPFQLVYL